MDTRTTAENDWLEENLGGDELFRRTGMPVHTINTLPKLLWIQRNEPKTWRAAKRFLLYEDFFLNRMSGDAVISGCLASRTQMMNLRTGAWDSDILEKCAIDANRLARVSSHADGVAGETSRAFASEIGLSRPLILASGGHDQACAALGCGVIDAGQAMVSTGTAEVVEVAMDNPSLAPALQHGGISVYRHVVPGLFLAMTLNHCGGLLLRWMRDTLGKWEVGKARSTGQDSYDLLLENAPAGPSGLLVLPHFTGSGTPTLDTHSLGAIVGLSNSTTLAEIAKAALEGLCFELRQNTDLLQANGVQIDELRAVGGGANSPLWLQLKADICDVPLRRLRSSEAACMGAAILAGRAAGVYTSIDEGVQAAVSTEEQIAPNSARSGHYEPWYQLYTTLYPQLRDTLHAISALSAARQS
jgi:xylulokinase